MRRHFFRLAVALLTFLTGLAVTPTRKLPPRPVKLEQAPPPAPKQSEVRLTPITSRYEYGSHSFMGVAILNDGEMWAAGYDGQNPERMWHSADGGLHWERRSVPTGGYILHDVDFVNNWHGWAVGNSNIILSTSDGGGTWEAGTLSRKITGWAAVDFVNDDVGYAAGSTALRDPATDTATFGIEILRTTDGGRSWRLAYKDKTSQSIHRLTAVSESLALLVIDGSFILRTEDAGATWKRIKLPDRWISSVRFSADGTGWAVGREGCFYFSTDQGRSWQRPAGVGAELLKRDWNDVGFIDPRLGFAVAEDGSLAVSRDGGTTWAELDFGVTDRLHEIIPSRRGAIILGSSYVYKLQVAD